jgi:hypothetical protein
MMVDLTRSQRPLQYNTDDVHLHSLRCPVFHALDERSVLSCNTSVLYVLHQDD